MPASVITVYSPVNLHFFGHLRWTPVILLGYAASTLTHLWINSATFQLFTAG